MFLKYLNTIRYLRCRQILFKLWYIIRIHFNGRFISKINSTPGEIDCELLKPKVPFLAYPWFQTDDIKRGKFKFLNEEAEYGDKINWHDSARSRLWRYNLHYFNYLLSDDGLPKQIGFKLISDWIVNNPPLAEDAWEPYPASLRIVNWIKFLSNVEQKSEIYDNIKRSLYQQTIYLEKSIEFDQLGNHVFKNIKALVFASLFFNSKSSENWLRKGIRLLNIELDDEILSDGGHIERSPMYHSMITEDCLDLLNILANSSNGNLQWTVEHLSSVSGKMINFLMGITHPDGMIPLMNDAAFGIEVQPSILHDYYQQLTGITVEVGDSQIESYPESGYFLMKPKPGDYLIIDCGPIGPDYQPGHGHCDTLSFELSLNGQRVIVDSGCCTYEEGAIRDYNRGNIGHNTLTIDGKNQSEMWGSFRFARRAYPLEPRINMNGNGLQFEGAHTGYKRLRGNLIHKRSVSWEKNLIIIEDDISGKYKHDFLLTLNFHPTYKIFLNGGMASIDLDDKSKLLINPLCDAELSMINGWYCPEFGKRVQNNVLILKGMKSAPFKTGWSIRII